MTVIMPVYDESATLPSTLDAITAYAAANPDYRFIFVNDGSTDDTAAVLRSRLALIGGGELRPDGTWTNPGADHTVRVALLDFPQNRGKGAAVRRAMSLLDSEFVCFMDGDLAYLPEDHLPALMAALETHDVVIGARHESPEERRNTKRLRRVMGWTFNRIVRIGLGLPMEDTQAGVKAFRAPAARTIFERSRLSGFSFDVELLFIAKRHSLTIAEIPAKVARAHRKKPTKVNLATEPARMLRDLFKVRWNWLRGRYGAKHPALVRR
ncbi:glycosyltransferase family 2 protein [soil metagenome]